MHSKDSADKVCGRFMYLADEVPSNALHAVPLLSKCANAIIKNIDASKALAIGGVTVLTYKDVPAAKYNSGEWHLGQGDFPDETILTGHARFVGDDIALVLAESESKARKALALIKVDYEELPSVTDLDSAAENASLLHDDGMKEFPGHMAYGDVNDAFAKAAYVESDVITTPKTHHAAMETHCVLAIPRADGALEIHSPCQIAYGVQHAISVALGMPACKVRVVKSNMGGTFGGKQEQVFETLCAWAAQKLHKPVFLNTNREETMSGTKTRTAMKGKITTAMDKDGMIIGRRFDVIVDAGAYLTGAKKVMMAMCKKASRLYRIPALEFNGRAVRTSTTPSGAFRGYGSPQIAAITEIHTDLLCRRLGWDPVDFRMKNLVREFDEDPSGGANIGRARVRECLERGAERFGWSELRTPSRNGRFATGAGFACCTHGNGYYKTIYHDYTKMSLHILEDGSAVLRSPVHDLGTGVLTAMAQIVAEVTGISPELITVTEADTNFTSYDCGCQASRTMYVCGECARLVAEKTLKLLCVEASKLWNVPVAAECGMLVTPEGRRSFGEAATELMLKRNVSIEAEYEYAPKHNPASFGVHFAQVTVDTLTGLVKVDKYLAVHDIGQAINHVFTYGQIYGGVQMGIGMALTETLSYDAKGRPSARNFDKYHMVNAPDMPDVDILLIEDNEPGGPFGGKSIGETCTAPVAPAIVNAVNRALGTSLVDLPLLPARITAALHE